MCSQKAATKRERDINSGALTIHPREQRLIPKASEIVEAVELLHRLVDSHYGEVLAALPPYQHAEKIKTNRGHAMSMGVNASMEDEQAELPHPASEFGSSVTERPEADIGAWFPMRAWVSDFLMDCSNVWQMANIGEEYWELRNNSQKRNKERRRKLAVHAPLASLDKRTKDLSGFWNVMAVAVRAWKRQHELIVRKLGERVGSAPVRLPPQGEHLEACAFSRTHADAPFRIIIEVTPLSLFSQFTGKISSTAIRLIATRQVSEMLEIVEIGLRSTELDRPVHGTTFPHPNAIALDVLRETLLLCEVGLIETHAMTGWFSSQMASPVQVDDEVLPKPSLDLTDKQTFLPQAWSLEQVKRVEMMIRRMSSPRVSVPTVNRVYDAALLQAVAGVSDTEDKVEYAELHDLGFFDAAPGQPPAPHHLQRAEKLAALSNPGKRILLEEFKQFSSFSSFVKARAESGLKEATIQWDSLCNPWEHYHPQSWFNEPSWRTIWQELDASTKRTGSKPSEAQPNTEKAGQVHARAFFAAWKVVQVRAFLRMCSLKIAVFRRSPCVWDVTGLARPGSAVRATSPIQDMLNNLQQWDLGLDSARSLNASRLEVMNAATQQDCGGDSTLEELFKECREKYEDAMQALGGEIEALRMFLV